MKRIIIFLIILSFIPAVHAQFPSIIDSATFLSVVRSQKCAHQTIGPYSFYINPAKESLQIQTRDAGVWIDKDGRVKNGYVKQDSLRLRYALVVLNNKTKASGFVEQFPKMTYLGSLCPAEMDMVRKKITVLAQNGFAQLRKLK